MSRPFVIDTFPADVVALAVSMFKSEGWSMKRFGQEFGVSEMSAHHWLKRHGIPRNQIHGDDGTRFEQRVRREVGGCWPWAGALNAKGYGIFTWLRDGRKFGLAHRYSYEQRHGVVPGALELDHLCRNRACVNPDHLEAVTHAVNVRRGSRATKTHCVHGHSLADAYRDRRGYRVCRTCKLERPRWRGVTRAR